MADFLEYLKSNVFPGESGGDYNALFGFSNRPGGQFGGVNLTDMTVDEALAFADPSGPYGQWVKGQVGRVATPMGAYQIVGTTLGAAKKGLGLTGSEKMTPELQDQLGAWIYQNQGPGAWEAWGKGGGGSVVASTKGGMPMGLLDTPTEDDRGGLIRLLTGESKPWTGRMNDIGAVLLALSGSPAAGPLMEQVGQRRAERREQMATNRTAQWLASLGRDDLAAAMLTGALDPKIAAQLAMTPPEQPSGVEINGKLVNPKTGEIIADLGADPKEVFGNEVELLKTYRAEPEVQAYNGVANYYGRMVSAYDIATKNPATQGQGDLAMVYSYMKMLDPGSTVMQGEYASASQTAGVPDQVRNVYNSIIQGATLTDAQRRAFLEQAEGMMKATADRLARVNEFYTGTAARGGVDTGFLINPVIPDWRTMGVAPPPATTFTPAVP